ncbi:Beta-phosphoglucomutase [Candidatus Arsenophonus lipoptenae]|uniref:Beta-phosphoglucomutase n=1 Tax=Candidatus Arsenophonus lipoptenae TaxID=634113 RepID=A0A109QEF8_9GAMM|nr:beta-phosphoglucomutase [Candidatus Arsenophonus lipoptenae]AMA64811.1 Beta-phosphoglucomutase [Candidatus Arsenophonus lipoptenae]
MKKGMIFDLDGVIVNTTFYHFKAWQYLAKQINIYFDISFNENLKGISRIESLEKILIYGDKEKIFNTTEKYILMAKKNDYYVKLLSKLSKRDIFPGVLDFIKQTRKKKIPCAIASASKNATLILERLNIKDYFNVIVDPYSVTNSKPNPEIFLMAANLINILPSEAIGFEDSQAGIDGLNKANIFSVGISSENNLVGAKLLVNSFKKINFEQLIMV